jgi:hypothetical protein
MMSRQNYLLPAACSNLDNLLLAGVDPIHSCGDMPGGGVTCELANCLHAIDLQNLGDSWHQYVVSIPIVSFSFKRLNWELLGTTKFRKFIMTNLKFKSLTF